MNAAVANCLKTMKLATPQAHRNIVIFPLTTESPGAEVYITLTEALADHLFTVTEVSQGGSVPELKVTNSGDRPVLLLDGEEVAGAKQNRVLNTSILVPSKQDIVIPVSCTEQGRWAYATPEFYDSGTVMAHSVRVRKSQSVSESLRTHASFRSNQGEVWDGIASLHEAVGSESPTAAMRDAFDAKRGDLEEALKAFPPVPGQQGLLVIINGMPVGFDLVSLSGAYSRLHSKLTKSYVMDALVTKPSGKSESETVRLAAQDFLYQAGGCEEKKFKSVGHGDDYRFKGTQVAGSALLHHDAVIHMAFFRIENREADVHMSALNRRRAYRTR